VTASLGIPRLHLRRLGSTNDRARELAAAGAPHGTLVTAAEQTAGRGRQGRSWTAPPGRALLMSLVLRRWPALLPLAAGVALAEVTGPAARVKWPNDVLVEGRKVGGILAEGRPQEGWMVLGIGLNVALRPEDFPPELAQTGGTLGLDPAETEMVLERLLKRLEAVLEMPDAEVLAGFGARDALAGREVRWGRGSGVAVGIDSAGRLLVTDSEGTEVTLDAGEVHLERPG
jgi:BirA family biotin operon repressor/biotin-[acetyl-CoA-carboxylase] ligase